MSTKNEQAVDAPKRLLWKHKNPSIQSFAARADSRPKKTTLPVDSKGAVQT